MVPFQVDPSWYERHWLSAQPTRRRRMSHPTLIEFAIRLRRFLWPVKSKSDHHAPGRPTFSCSERQKMSVVARPCISQNAR
jgi:hypothetical protein